MRRAAATKKCPEPHAGIAHLQLEERSLRLLRGPALDGPVDYRVKRRVEETLHERHRCIVTTRCLAFVARGRPELEGARVDVQREMELEQ